MVEFDEANDVAAAAATIAVEQVLAGVNEKAGLMVGVQRTKPQEAAEADGPSLLPIVCLQILQQRNLLFQFIEGASIHGLLASIGRIRQATPRAPATRGGGRQRRTPMAPTVSQEHTLSRRRRAHRRRVDGSGERDGSLQCGAACSTETPAAMLSQACCRQRKLKCPERARQSGKIVKVLLHGLQIPRRTQIQSWH